ncbi:MAG: lectin [Leptolyngbya sp.]|nr:MAG: lectin [Leptolyngbya sp.]
MLILATCLISGLVAVLPAYALDTLSPGQQLNRGESLASQNGCFTFILQDDGNLVLYQQGNKALWQAGTSGKAVARAVMQGDGNLVLYGYDNTPVWNSRTDGKDGSRLIIQNDGNVVIYTPSQNRAVWNTKTGTTQVCR